MSSSDNLTAVLYGINDIKLEQRPVPTIKDDEVLLRMETVGICGSDVHYLVNGRIGDFIVKKPMVIGHEASGTVIKCGLKVTSLKIGDRVAIEPGVPCRICNYCKEGRYNLCPEMAFCATPPFDGNLTRFYAHPADFCFKLPNHVSLDEAALLEPLSVGVHACKKGNVGVGSIVLILGAGPIGLVTLLTAKAMGASKILIADLQLNRLQKAKELGADFTFQMTAGADDSTLLKKVVEILGQQPTITLECSGADQCVRLAIQGTISGGTVVMVGMGKPEITVPLISALAREVNIFGCFRYCNDYGTALELVASGKVNVKPLITHHFKMEQTVEAFQTAQDPTAQAIKILIHANPEWKL